MNETEEGQKSVRELTNNTVRTHAGHYLVSVTTDQADAGPLGPIDVPYSARDGACLNVINR